MVLGEDNKVTITSVLSVTQTIHIYLNNICGVQSSQVRQFWSPTNSETWHNAESVL